MRQTNAANVQKSFNPFPLGKLGSDVIHTEPRSANPAEIPIGAKARLPVWSLARVKTYIRLTENYRKTFVFCGDLLPF